MNKDRRKDIDAIIKLLRDAQPMIDDAKGKVGDAANAERESFDNMPEGLQQGDNGQQIDAAATALEEVQQTLDDLDLDDLITKLEEAQQ